MKNKKQVKNKPVFIEALIDELEAKGKTGIKLPCTELYTKKYLCFLKQLVDKKLLAQETYDKKSKEIESRTLDPNLYKKFYKALQIQNTN